MRIFAEHKIEKARLDRTPNADDRIKNTLALMLARFLEDKIQVEKKSDDTFTETHRVEIFALSTKDVQEIGEIILTFESYARDYPAMHAVRDKLERIREIFLKESFD